MTENGMVTGVKGLEGFDHAVLAFEERNADALNRTAPRVTPGLGWTALQAYNSYRHDEAWTVGDALLLLRHLVAYLHGVLEEEPNHD
ncbi:MAG TPA: hypothetical protein VF171_09205 [Trueperaceae bacterium]